MKNLTLKKIAFGLFLAGYATSSAFAINATTSSTIVGNEPVLQSMANATDHTMTIEVTDADHPDTKIGNRPAKVGDYIKIKFKLSDKDDDKLSAETIQSTLQVFIKKTRVDTEAWTAIPEDKLTDLTTTVPTTGDSAEIVFKISDEFAGAEKIGYKILERTQYGAPFANQWLLVTDIWAQTDPNTIEPTDKKKPLDTGPTDPQTGSHGPGDSTNNGSGPIESVSTKIGIFLFDGAAIDPAKDYSRDATLIPKYGDKFAAVVWNDTVTKDEKLTVGEVSKTGSYTFTWKVSGDYDYAALNQLTGVAVKPAVDEPLTEGVTNGAAGVDWITGTGNVIFLGSESLADHKHNAHYNTDYPAGLQGYKLKVITN